LRVNYKKFVLDYKNYRKILYWEFKNYRNFILFTYLMLNYRAIIYEDWTEIIEYWYIDDIYDKYDKEIKRWEVIKIEICI